MSPRRLDGLLPRILAVLVFLACAAGIWMTLPDAPPEAADGGGDCLATATAEIERRKAAGEVGAEEAMILRQQASADCAG